MAVPTYALHRSTKIADSSSGSVTFTSGELVAGDVLVALIANQDAAATNNEGATASGGGFSGIRTVAPTWGPLRLQALWRRWTTGDPLTFTFNFTSASGARAVNAHIVIYVIRGARQDATPIHADAGQDQVQGNFSQSISITTTEALLFAAFMHTSANLTAAWAAGNTERYEDTVTGLNTRRCTTTQGHRDATTSGSHTLGTTNDPTGGGTWASIAVAIMPPQATQGWGIPI